MLNKILGGVKIRFVEGFIREYVNNKYGDILTVNSVKMNTNDGIISDVILDLTLNGEANNDKVIIKGLRVNDNGDFLTFNADSVDATRPWIKALVNKAIEKIKLDSEDRKLFKGASFNVASV